MLTDNRHTLTQGELPVHALSGFCRLRSYRDIKLRSTLCSPESHEVMSKRGIATAICIFRLRLNNRFAFAQQFSLDGHCNSRTTSALYHGFVLRYGVALCDSALLSSLGAVRISEIIFYLSLVGESLVTNFERAQGIFRGARLPWSQNSPRCLLAHFLSVRPTESSLTT